MKKIVSGKSRILAGVLCILLVSGIPMVALAKTYTVVNTITHNVYHEHEGNETEGGGCYTQPIYHTHDGSTENGEGCYQTPVYHVHDGSTESGGACYETPIYHEHSGSSATGGGCYTGAVYHSHNGGCYTYGVIHSCHTVAADCHGTDSGGQTWYTWTYSCGASVYGTSGDGYHGTTTMGNILSCGRGGAVEGYTLQCGKDSTTIDAYALSCPKTAETIDSYELSCGKTEETIDGYALNCGKTEETVESTYETYEEVVVDDGIPEQPEVTEEPSEAGQEDPGTVATPLPTATPSATPLALVEELTLENGSKDSINDGENGVSTANKQKNPIPSVSPSASPEVSPSMIPVVESKKIDAIKYDAPPKNAAEVKKVTRIEQFLLSPAGRTITITTGSVIGVGLLLLLLAWWFGSICIYNDDTTGNYILIGRKRAYKENGILILDIPEHVTDRAYTNRYRLKAGGLFCKRHAGAELEIRIENIRTTVTLDTEMVFRT